MLKKIRQQIQAPKAKSVVNDYPLRIIACGIVLMLHLRVLPENTSAGVWLFVILHTIVYPHLAFFFSTTRRQEARNVIVDAFAYGCCVALWGFAPLLLTIFTAGALMTTLAAGGIPFFIVSSGLFVVGALVVGMLNGFYFLDHLDPITEVLAYISLTLYTWSLGYMTFRVNTQLDSTKRHLSRQKAVVEDVNILAEALNSQLDFDEVMNTAMSAFNRISPVEEVFIILIDKNKQVASLQHLYGEAINDEERDLLRDLSFSLEDDKNSVFVIPLLTKKLLYVPKISRENVAKSARVDQSLYDFKPSCSLASFPIFIRGEVVGGLTFVNYNNPLNLDTAQLDTLSQYVIHVGSAIRNAQLYEEAKQARLQAERSEQVKARFLANMSHEIRSPMTAIIGYSEALLEENLSEEERVKFTQVVIRSGQHLMSVINDVLDLSKIESEKLEVEQIPVEMSVIIEAVRSQIGLKAHEKGLKFLVEIKTPVPKVFYSDPTRIKQVLFNLGSNAIKFTDSGSVILRVEYVKQNNQLRFSMIDSGIGLTVEQQAKIFQPFSQADTSTSRQYGGTGLGLSISQELANLLGGSLKLESDFGQGSTFSLTVNPGELDAVEWFETNAHWQSLIEDSKGRSVTSLIIPRFEGNVLIVDDNIENLNLAARILEETGLNITALHGSGGVESILTDQKFDIILLDIQMPIIDGESLIKKIRESGYKNAVIAFTANVMQSQIEKYYRIGFDDFIAKPINRRELYEKIQHCLQRGNQTLCGSILLVDDNLVNRTLIERIIHQTSPHIEVSLAANGVEALSLVSKQSFDLILMDMEMPVMGGVDAVIALRERGYKSTIYMLTGNVGYADQLKTKQAGADGHMAKPVDKASLQKIIGQYLNKK